MKSEPSCPPQISAVRRALGLAGGTVLLATSCVTSPTYGPEANIFAPGQPRYGYGSPRPPVPADRTVYAKPEARKTPDIKRDPNNTTVDVTPPESKPDPAPSAEPKTDPASPSDPAVVEKPIDSTEAPETISKPAAPREDLPFGQPVVGKKGYVYSPYAPDKGQVDVQDIPAGTKVKCPYTGKVFRVP